MWYHPPKKKKKKRKEKKAVKDITWNFIAEKEKKQQETLKQYFDTPRQLRG
jgi:hypothetical protein